MGVAAGDWLGWYLGYARHDLWLHFFIYRPSHIYRHRSLSIMVQLEFTRGGFRPETHACWYKYGGDGNRIWRIALCRLCCDAAQAPFLVVRFINDAALLGFDGRGCLAFVLAIYRCTISLEQDKTRHFVIHNQI